MQPFYSVPAARLIREIGRRRISKFVSVKRTLDPNEFVLQYWDGRQSVGTYPQLLYRIRRLTLRYLAKRAHLNWWPT
jgi:hypothetical protein